MGLNRRGILQTSVAMLASAALGAPWLAAQAASTRAEGRRPGPGPAELDPAAIRGHVEGPVRDDIVPGELVMDPPTLENLGFRWFIEGDSNRNAAVAVAWRKAGETTWRAALPMLRVHHEIVTRATTPYRVGNLFAGSVLFLEPGTDYEIRLTMTDPDGGAPAAPRVLSATTRTEPRVADDGRVLRVLATGEPPQPGTFPSVATALEEARPGDVILLGAGIHEPGAAPVQVSRSGTSTRPIILRGAGAEHSILLGVDTGTDLLRVEANHIIIEDLTLRRARTGIRGGERGKPGASWLTVRNCRIEEVVSGIWTGSEYSANWLISDNIITGMDQQWYPRPRDTYMAGSHTGVNVYGQGHVVRHNRISRFSDALAIYNFGNPDPLDIHRHGVNMDFHNNDLSFAVDDTFEADYGCHNIRFYRNRCYNTHTALSVQPAYGGPIYLIRNEAFQITQLNLKWNNHGSGMIAYHNTLVSHGSAFSAPQWSNSHLRNNLLIGGRGRILATGTFTPDRSSLDYNGWHGDPAIGEQVRWTAGDGPARSYATLADFAAATGHELNGRVVGRDIFLLIPEVEPSATVAPGDFDLRLKRATGAQDAGVRLPGINDDYEGAAPDLGAHEAGHPPPHYGPRPRITHSGEGRVGQNVRFDIGL
jgi:hypothetical protein